MARARVPGKALRLFPWLVAGEIARIRGFFDARRRFKTAGIFERPAAARAVRA